MLAKLVPHGRAVGLDLWRFADQSGNGPQAAHRNLAAEGVSDRSALETGDMTAMPFPDATFDLVASNLAIHNIHGEEGRSQAVEEAVRVLRPGGRLVIADLMRTTEYAKQLRARGMEGVEQRRLGWRFWYGGPWMPTGLVTAAKPA
jgi:ubiquinone/menaquinone biosynthesis C-methylase UbiE